MNFVEILRWTACYGQCTPTFGAVPCERKRPWSKQGTRGVKAKAARTGMAAAEEARRPVQVASAANWILHDIHCCHRNLADRLLPHSDFVPAVVVFIGCLSVCHHRPRLRRCRPRRGFLPLCYLPEHLLAPQLAPQLTPHLAPPGSQRNHCRHPPYQAQLQGCD